MGNFHRATFENPYISWTVWLENVFFDCGWCGQLLKRMKLMNVRQISTSCWGAISRLKWTQDSLHSRTIHLIPFALESKKCTYLLSCTWCCFFKKFECTKISRDGTLISSLFRLFSDDSNTILSNIERTRTCSSIGDQIHTPYI